MISELRDLAELILAEVLNVEAVYTSANQSFPSLNTPTTDPFIDDPKFVQSSNNIVAASSRLIASLRNPHAVLHELSGAMYTSAFLNVVVEVNITEALREAGSHGMHVDDLAAKVSMDPVRLGQVMRYLGAMHHIYKEIAPDIFVNNRMSAALDTSKSFEEVKNRCPTRYDFTEGSAATVALTSETGIKGAARLAEIVTNPQTAFNHNPDESPLIHGVNAKGPYWQWLERPENEKTLNQFSAAMRTIAQMFPPSTIDSAFDWDALAEGSLVVDVGGGVGGTTLPLARDNLHLRFVVQDRPALVSAGETYWKKAWPEALDMGLVALEAHDFFEPQPDRDVTIFLLRFILHNWPNDQSKKLLSNLRAAANPETKLILLELIVPYTCPDGAKHSSILDTSQTGLPEVLCGNPGLAKATTFMTDAQMLNFFNSQERTIGQWVELLASAGWVVEKIRDGNLSSIICKAAT